MRKERSKFYGWDIGLDEDAIEDCARKNLVEAIMESRISFLPDNLTELALDALWKMWEEYGEARLEIGERVTIGLAPHESAWEDGWGDKSLVFEVDLEKTLTQELDAICTEEDAEVFISAMERVIEAAKHKRGTYAN